MIRATSLFLCLVLSTLVCGTTWADERLTDYRVTLDVERDGSITVTERIRAKAELKQIRRGIFREFSLDNVERYQDPIPWKILDIRRDGEPIESFTERRGSAFRVYLGTASTALPAAGEYNYLLQYRVERAVLQRDDSDLVYWNVIPFYWQFPIDRIEVEVTLPSGFMIDKWWVYSGAPGWEDNGLGLEGNVFGQRTLRLVRDAVTPARQGVTVHIVTRPDLVAERYPGSEGGWAGFVSWAAEQPVKRVLGPLLIVLLAALGVYWMWSRYGRDPVSPVVIPEYYPPEQLSPAATRYLHQLGSVKNERLLVTALVSAAAKGVIRIDVDSDAEVTTIERITDDNSALSVGEQIVLKNLLNGERAGDCFELIKPGMLVQSAARRRLERQAELLRETGKLLKRSLDEEVGAITIIRRPLAVAGLWLFGLLVSGLCLYAMANRENLVWQIDDLLIFAVVGFAIASAALVGMGSIVGWILSKLGFSTLWDLNHGDFHGFGVLHMIKLVLPIGLLALGVFVVLLVLGGGSTSALVAYPAWPSLLLSVFLVYVYFMAQAFHSPTVQGAALRARIQGLKLYISAAEHPDIERERPAKTPEQFTALYPYAFALSLEAEWVDQFSEELEKWAMDMPSLHWYHHGVVTQGTPSLGAVAGFTAGLSEAVTAGANYSPPSSGGSGSSGGGFAGGGGGGGGGGGF